MPIKLFLKLLILICLLLSCSKGEVKISALTKSLDHVIKIGDKNLKRSIIFKTPKGIGILKSLRDFAVDENGNVYIGDKKGNKIWIFSEKGDFRRMINLGKLSYKGRKKRLNYFWALSAFKDTILASATSGRIPMKKYHLAIISTGGELLWYYEPKLIPEDIEINRFGIWFSEYSFKIGLYKVYRMNGKGRMLTCVGKINRDGGNSHKFNNLFSIDSLGNIYISYLYRPLIEKYSLNGKKEFSINYQWSINNKKNIFEERVVDNTNLGRNGGIWKAKSTWMMITNPICYSLAVDDNGIIYLIVPADHNKKEWVKLLIFNNKGVIKEKITLPDGFTELQIDSKGNYYFLDTIWKQVVKYEIY